MRSINIWVIVAVLAFIFGVFFALDQAKATVYIDNTDITGDYWSAFDYDTGGDGYLFTAPSTATIDRVTEAMCRLWDYESSATLWANIALVTRPGNNYTIIATSTIYDLDSLEYVSLGATCADLKPTKNFSFSSGVSLTIGNEYIVIFQTSTTSNEQVIVMEANDVDDYEGVQQAISGTYSQLDLYDPYIYISYGESLTDKIWFDYPQDGYELDNSIWNDWELWYDLEADDLGIWNMILVVSQDIYGNSFTDYELVTTTTNLTGWVLDRGNDFTDGAVYSKAKMVAIDDCDSYYDTDCVWYTVDETDVMVWYASSTGYNILDPDFPYGTLPGFYPATSSDYENASSTNKLLSFFNNIFPFSIINQIRERLNTYRINASSYSGIEITMQDIIPQEYSGIANDSTILSSEIIEDNLGIWTTHIYPLIQLLIWLAVLLYILIRLRRFASADD